MAPRRKNRTHLKGPAGGQSAAGPGNAPKSFVIKHGQVGSSVAQLVRDMRKVMEPNTATRLKERSRNKLKDYLTLAPALKVSHLLAFTLTPIAPSLRLVRLPAGPTFSFRIERYSLVKDLLHASRRPRSIGAEYLSPPLLVLAAFPAASPTTPPHLPLLAQALQSLFPALAPTTLALRAARRVVLVAHDAARGTLAVRHYVVAVRPHGVARRVRRVVAGGAGAGAALDLGSCADVAEYVLRAHAGHESAASASGASSAGEDSDGAVALAADYVGRNNRRGERRAVRLDEVGPRMELRLVKIVEGVPGKEGEVMYHHFVTKSRTEEARQRADHAAKERLRKQRREEQERNVKRKNAEAKKSGKDEDAVDMEEEGEDGGDAGDVEEDGEGDDGAWDDEEEISEGDESDNEGVGDSSESEVEHKPPQKRRKV